MSRISTTKTFDFSCTRIPFVISLSAHTIHFTTDLNTSSFNFQIPPYTEQFLSSFDPSEVTSDGVRATSICLSLDHEFAHPQLQRLRIPWFGFLVSV